MLAEDKRVMIIGGSGGIGSELVRLFEERNIKSIVVDQTVPEGRIHDFIACDLTQAASVNAAIDQLSKNYTKELVPYVINAAGIFGAYSDGIFDAGRLQKAMAVNVVGTLSIISGWYEFFGKYQGGVVCNVSSAAARRATSDVAYGVSKAALDSATKSLARAWAPAGVWVFGVAPGLVTTKMAEPMTIGRRKRLANNSLIKRETSPDEVAELILTLVLTAPCLITGTVVDASGGIA